ncbi:MAG: type II toxin-antitoxin system Phd/YefM family antitoxin [Acidimicrobiia bacterium]|nr:type II toxin-antitoxin system Phd/YefM family antitoxin [Acidimicrobiia bacterium]
MDTEPKKSTHSRPDGRVLAAGEFKTHCLRLMDEVHETGTEIIVTKHRRPVVRISPVRTERPNLVGSCVDQLQILADIDSDPAIPMEDWDVIERPDNLLNPERYQ